MGFPPAPARWTPAPPTPHLRPWPFHGLHSLLFEGGRPYPWLLCCALHVDTHQERRNGEPLERDHPKGKGTPHALVGLRWGAEDPAFFGGIPGSRPRVHCPCPHLHCPAKPPCGASAPVHEAGRETGPRIHPGEVCPWGAGEEGVSPSGGGGCNASWLQEGARTQSFGPLIQTADSFEKTLMLGKIDGRKRRG